MPLVRSLGRDLWEVRSSLPGGRIARVLFCIQRGGMILLHGFIKKTQKTPQLDIDLALKRKNS
jgi:phage-related protein